MTNIITNLQERNKELSDKISNLEKQLTDKEENFKIRIWNAVHGLTENVEEYTGVTLKTLERFTWPENGWISYPEKNGLEIGRVVFSNGFTPENIVKSFGKEAQNYEEAFSFTYQENKELKEKNTILEKTNQKLEKELEFEKVSASCHLDAVGVCEDWCNEKHANKIESLVEELDNNKTMLLDFVRRLAEEKAKNMKLVEQSEEDKQTLKNLNERLVEEKQNSLKIYLDKPLPKLPNKFKTFKRKVKTKFQHLVEKVKSEKQELEQKLIAKIELKIGSC